MECLVDIPGKFYEGKGRRNASGEGGSLVERTWRNKVRGNCNKGVIYERRINFNF